MGQRLNNEEEDRELVKRTQAGDAASFEKLVRKYQDRVFNLALAIIRDKSQAEDLAQEVFAKAYFSLNNFKGASGFFTWIYRLAINHCLDWLRKGQRKGQVSLDEVPGYQLDRMVNPGHGQGPEDSQERRERHQLLHKALTSLSGPHRAVIVLKDVEGFSYKEIATLVNCSEGTVKSRLFRAREELKRKLAPILSR